MINILKRNTTFILVFLVGLMMATGAKVIVDKAFKSSKTISFKRFKYLQKNIENINVKMDTKLSIVKSKGNLKFVREILSAEKEIKKNVYQSVSPMKKKNIRLAKINIRKKLFKDIKIKIDKKGITELINDKDMFVHYGFKIETEKRTSFLAIFNDKKFLVALEQLAITDEKRKIALKETPVRTPKKKSEVIEAPPLDVQISESNNKIINDEINIAQSGVSKKLVNLAKFAEKNKTYKKDAREEELDKLLQEFDYSAIKSKKPTEEKTTLAKKLEPVKQDNEISSKVKISDTVVDIIKREMSSSDKVPSKNLPIQRRAQMDYNNDYSSVSSQTDILDTVLTSPKEKPVSIKTQKDQDKRILMAMNNSGVGAPSLNEIMNLNTNKSLTRSPRKGVRKKIKIKSSSYKLTTQSVKLNEGIEDNKSFVEFVPAYNPNERFNNNSDGDFLFKFNLLKGKHILRGTLRSRDYYPVKVNLSFNGHKKSSIVPLINRDTLDDFMRNENLTGIGAFVLIHLSKDMDSIDVEGNYEAKVFLDQDFKVVEEGNIEDNDFDYVLYIGAQLGNTLISYKTLDDQVATKIVHLVENEIFYDNTELAIEKMDKVSILERNLLGSRTRELALEKENILILNTDNIARYSINNIFEMPLPVMPISSRNYLVFNHLQSNIYVGYDENKTLELPNREFIVEVFKTHGIEELDGRCLVQININKDQSLVNFEVDGESARGSLNIDTYYLDKDGLFNDTPTDFADKIFVLSDEQGVMNAKIEYSNSKVQFLKTYCPKDTYLIEQL